MWKVSSTFFYIISKPKKGLRLRAETEEEALEVCGQGRRQVWERREWPCWGK